MTTGELAAKLIAEGKNTGCDIIYDLEYNYMLKLDESGGLTDVSELCNENDFCEDTEIIPAENEYSKYSANNIEIPPDITELMH